MRRRYTQQARADRRAIMRYLQDHRGFDQADAFLSQLDACIGAILEYPQAWPLLGRSKTERCRPFVSLPYYVAYAVRGQTVIILAVGHQRGEKGYWR